MSNSRAVDELMSTWRLDCPEYRNRILADLVTGVLFYSGVCGSSSGRGSKYMGLVRNDLTGVNAVLQMLVCCVHPCHYSGFRTGRTGIFDVLSRLLVSSVECAPSVELVRAVLLFVADHRGGLIGDGEGVLWRKFVFLTSMGGHRVVRLFTSRLSTVCCGVWDHEWGLSRFCAEGDWDHRGWCDIRCLCGKVVPFQIHEPAECLLVRSDGGVTALAELDLQDRATGNSNHRLLYDLCATCVRTPSGRYVCYSNRSRPVSVWWRFDDDIVESSNLDDVCSVAGVVLMVYVLREIPCMDVVHSTCMDLVDVHWKPSSAIAS